MLGISTDCHRSLFDLVILRNEGSLGNVKATFVPVRIDWPKELWKQNNRVTQRILWSGKRKEMQGEKRQMNIIARYEAI